MLLTSEGSEVKLKSLKDQRTFEIACVNFWITNGNFYVFFFTSETRTHSRIFDLKPPD